MAVRFFVFFLFLFFFLGGGGGSTCVGKNIGVREKCIWSTTALLYRRQI